MTLVARLRELEARVPRGMMLGLDRVERALARLGDPHLAIPCVHVAGSNGKGSTCAMLESIARAAGKRTGLYTSPHLVRFAERIRFDGEPIADDAFDAALARVFDRCDADLTFFETVTVAAFVAFAEAKIDLAILEVGLGGRLDATNVVVAPLATAITSISLEHTALLGSTLDAIAREKAGILKRGVPVVLGALPDEAMRAAEDVAAGRGAGPIVRAARYEGDVGLEGPHQRSNAGVAAAVARFIPGVDEAAIARGIASVRWPGRLERLDVRGRTVLLDCAHNEEGAAALASSLREAAIDPNLATLVFGALADKSWEPMLRQIAPFAERRIYTSPKGRAPASAENLARIAAGIGVEEPTKAVDRAIDESAEGTTIIVAGSAYLVGEVRAHLLGLQRDPIVAL